MQQLATSEVVLASYKQTLKEENLDNRTRSLCEFSVQNWEKVQKNCTGYNLGCNCGSDAGQSQLHFHYHLIPRFSGDCARAFGGIRNCISERGDYRQAAA